MLSLVEHCPFCEQRSIRRRLARDGSYGRGIPLGNGAVPGKIFRKYCRPCDVSFSLIPDFILRGQRYGRLLVVAWLWAWLRGAACRSVDFLIEQQIPRPLQEALTCWSDLVDAEPTRPGYRLMHRWGCVFSRRALRAIPAMVHACISLRCDFKREVAECLTTLSLVPRRARPLAVALGLWRAMQQATSTSGAAVELESALLTLSGFLAQRPLRASHGLRRASGDSLVYDTLAMLGRPPPEPNKEEAS